MVAIQLVAVGATVIGLFASVVKVIHHEVQKHQRRRQELITNNHPVLTAEIIINGNPHKFIKQANQTFAHYDLAIDYCITNAKELRFSISNLKTCIYPLANLLNHEFQEIRDSDKSGKEVAVSERRPKELLLSLPDTSENPISELPPPSSSESPSPLVEKTATLQSNTVRRIALEVNSINYIFEYDETRDQDLQAVSEELANKFCLANGRELLAQFIQLNQLSSDAEIRQVLYSRCYLPLQEALLQRLQEASRSNINSIT